MKNKTAVTVGVLLLVTFGLCLANNQTRSKRGQDAQTLKADAEVRENVLVETNAQKEEEKKKAADVQSNGEGQVKLKF